MTSELITKYRPKTLKEVVGHKTIIKSLESVVKRKISKTFLFAGPPGTGKTTLARIVAGALGCQPNDLLEIDAATNTGIDDMRSVTASALYKPLGGGVKAVLIDECFVAGTLVNTSTGTTAIEEIKAGDLVLGPLGEVAVKRILRKTVPRARLVVVCLGEERIICSSEHPFLTTEGWVEAAQLGGKAVYSVNQTLSKELCLLWEDLRNQKENLLRGLPESFLPYLRGQFQTEYPQSTECVRTKSQLTQSAKARPVEDRAVSIARVESYQGYEQTGAYGPEEHRGCAAETVECYDLEIDGYPAYAVSGHYVHNCHGLSKSAATSLLKILEEPPEHVVWLLCTTDPGKLSVAIRTRCATYELKSVGLDDLTALLDRVVEAEGLGLAEAVVDVCAKEASGSPRQALANLAVCSGAKTAAEARELLRSAESSEEAVALARLLVRGASWAEVQKTLNGLKEVSPESVRHVVRAYVSSVVLNAKSENAAGRGLEILDAFSQPYNSFDGITPLLLSCGKAVLGGED